MMGGVQLCSKEERGQNGHFYLAEKRTFLFGVDRNPLLTEETAAGIVDDTELDIGFRITADVIGQCGFA
jgi:hypothetical protein